MMWKGKVNILFEASCGTLNIFRTLGIRFQNLFSEETNKVENIIESFSGYRLHVY